TGGGISQNAGATLTVPNLNADGAQGVQLNQATNAVTMLAGDSLGGFIFLDSINLTVSSVDSGVSPGFGTGVMTQGSVIFLGSIFSNTLLTVNQSIGTTFLGGSGNNVALQFDNMTVNNFIGANGSRALLYPFSPGQLINLGGPDGAGTLGLTDAELDLVTASTLQVGSGT